MMRPTGSSPDANRSGPPKAGLWGRRALLLALALASCSRSKEDRKPAEAPAPAEPAAPVAPATAPAKPDAEARDTYRARIVDPELGDVPFYVSVPSPPAAGDAIVIDGARRVRLPAKWDGDQVTIGVDMFGAHITATRDPATRALLGAWEFSSVFSGRETRAFRAEVQEPDPAARMDLGTGAPVDLGPATTFWHATFSDSGDGKLELEQPAPGVFFLTITLRTGNVMYLAGNARGDTLRLTGFDGYSIYLFAGSFSPDRKSLTATWGAGPKLDWRESVTARRSSAPFDLDIVFKAETGVPASFLPDREKYAGKPLLVSLSATWCAACFNANPVLRELQAEHEKDGLQVVTLLYEMTDDPALDKQKAEAYKRDHMVTWDVVPVTGPISRAAELIPPMLEEVDLSAFPLAIFIGKDGVIRGAESGFPGPESREEYARTVAAYRAGVAALLADK